MEGEAMYLTSALMWQQLLGGGTLGTLSAADLDFNLMVASLPGGLTFTRASTNAGYYNSSGVFTLAGTNVPRFDYGPTPGANSLGLLLEDSRINLFLQSASPSTQNITCALGTYSVSCLGSGTLTPSANTAVGTGFAAATGGAPTQFTITTAGSVTFTVGGTITRPQVELGTPATMPIATVASSQTRPAELCVSTSGLLSATAGTLAVEAISNAQVGDLAGLDDGTVSNLYALRLGTTLRTVMLQFTGGSNTLQTAGIANSVPLGSLVKGAIRYGGTSMGMSVNGSAPINSTITRLPTISRLVIGAQRSSAPDGWIRRVRYWARALSDIEMQQATT